MPASAVIRSVSAGRASVVTAHRNAMVRIEVDDPGVLRDVDTPRDLSGGP
jgi:CTP:molybdopterin cytidylyltransferase MocA